MLKSPLPRLFLALAFATGAGAQAWQVPRGSRVDVFVLPRIPECFLRAAQVEDQRQLLPRLLGIAGPEYQAILADGVRYQACGVIEATHPTERDVALILYQASPPQFGDGSIRAVGIASPAGRGPRDLAWMRRVLGLPAVAGSGGDPQAPPAGLRTAEAAALLGQG